MDEQIGVWVNHALFSRHIYQICQLKSKAYFDHGMLRKNCRGHNSQESRYSWSAEYQSGKMSIYDGFKFCRYRMYVG